MKTILILAFLAGIAFAEFVEIGYKVCKADGTVSMVKADGCDLTIKDGKKVCLFKKGTRPVIQIAFKPSKPSDKLKTSVRAKVGGSAMVDFPQTNSDACTYGVKCPIVAGENQLFEQSIAITDNHPAGDIIQVNWQLTRPDSGKEACIIFLAEIVD
uniref:ML domain-containing protein n=1 Tax=Caenorhabditis tropicalis TaxID=1561998 RepID=A0A1I7USL7_9PELO